MRKPAIPSGVGVKTQLAALDWFQNRAYVHPLTCGVDSKHGNLIAGVTPKGTVYLECPDCDYIQDWIPPYVVNLYLTTMSLGASAIGYVDEDEGIEDE